MELNHNSYLLYEPQSMEYKAMHAFLNLFNMVNYFHK